MASNDIALGSNRLEHYDDPQGGMVVYIAIDPDGVWARSAFPDELMTLDYDEQGRLIGIEVIGRLASAVNSGLLQTVVDAMEDPEVLKRALLESRASRQESETMGA